MDFSLNQEQELFRGYVRKYLDNVGQTKIAREFIKGNAALLNKTYEGLAELGCTGITISEQYDGLDLGALDLVPVLEEMGRANLPGIYLETMAFAVPLLEKYGTEAQKQKYLPAIAAGTTKISLAWLEPNSTYAYKSVQLTAQSEGDSYSLNGVKTLVPDGDTADAVIVVARTGEAISLFLLDRSDEMEVKVQKSFDESRSLTELKLQDIIVPSETILGALHEGETILEEGLLHANAALCSLMVGAMEQIVEMTAEYANIRIQFGQPIGRFQAIKHRIVDMKVELETAKSLSYYANWTLESHAEDCAAAIYSARSFVTEAFIRAASDTIQIHGGIGFTEELDCQLYLKRARFYENYLGTVREYREKAAVALNW